MLIISDIRYPTLIAIGKDIMFRFANNMPTIRTIVFKTIPTISLTSDNLYLPKPYKILFTICKSVCQMMLILAILR